MLVFGPELNRHVRHAVLNNLKIKNFRIFEDLQVNKLGRVNLILGMNNSGKSTVLEALRIYAKQGHPSLLQEVNSAHDENFRMPREGEDDLELPYQHFFPGRLFPKNDDCPIYIGTIDESDYVKLEHAFYVQDIEEVEDPATSETLRRIRRRVTQKSQLFGATALSQALLVTSSKASRQAWIDLPYSVTNYRRVVWDEFKEIPTSYVPTQFLSLDYLASLWDDIALTGNEEFVTRALGAIDPDVAGLVFVEKRSERPARRDTGRTAIVKLSSVSRPVPLNSTGDGMLRILQLVLALFPAKGGFLLIDEFENGLHHSVQERVWELIFYLAVKLDIQVFATTHSWDCIEAFKNIATKTAEVGVVFRLGRSILKSDEGKVIATVFDEDRLADITKANIELR
jgi:hypothetical protein